MKKTFKAILEWKANLHALNWLTNRYPRIFMYHRFGNIRVENKKTFTTVFEQQVAMIKKNYRPISLSDYQGKIEKGENVPQNAVILTIDDGYEDFFIYAFPILKKYEVPATVFVTYNFLDGKTWLWPDRIEFIIKNSRFKEISIQYGDSHRIFSLVGEDNIHRAWSDIADYCLAIGHSRCSEFIDGFGRDLAVNVPENPTTDYRGLTWIQVREMAKEGIEIGSHTNNHPRLSTVDEKSLAHEIGDSKLFIENIIDREVSFFAYPFGSRSDIDYRAKQMVKDAGYKMAFAAYFGNNYGKDPFEINRISAGNDMGEFNLDIKGKKVLESIFVEINSKYAKC